MRSLLRLLALPLFLGCDRDADPAPAKPASAPVEPAAAHGAARADAPRPSAPAPTREIFGLRLGEADEAAITAWLDGRGLSCPGTPAPRRATVRYSCDGELPASALPERTLKGKLDQILLTRTDAGPVHDLSVRAIYSIPGDAAADYNARVAELQTLLGPPERSSLVSGEIDPSKPMLWYSSTWRFADLDVSVALLRAAGPNYGVTERWQLPGVEATAADRPGSVPIHGAPPKKSANPHAITTP